MFENTKRLFAGRANKEHLGKAEPILSHRLVIYLVPALSFKKLGMF